MKKSAGWILAVTIVLAAALPTTAGGGWTQFRGPAASGVADGEAIPAHWNVDEGKNLLWKTEIPGLGHSSPVTWGDAVFLTSAISGKADPELRVGLYGDIASVEDDTVHRLIVVRLDADSGKIVWQRTAFEGVPKIKRHTKASHANSTPATDGQHVVAFFGSEGLFAYDMDGKLLWKKELGVLDSGFFSVPEAQWGFGSSPVIHDGKVIVQADVQKDSFLAAFDVKTGKELWRTARDEYPTWGSPTVHVGEGRSQVIVNGFKQIGGYDLATGKELWRMAGKGDIPIPTPYVADGLIFLTQAHGPGSPILAIRTDAEGDISLGEEERSNDHVAWSRRGGGSYMPTTIVYRGLLYNLKDNGVLSVFDAATGKRHFQQRLGNGRSGFTASAVAGDGKVFFTSEEGEVYVLAAGTELRELGSNEMGEICMATPAIDGGKIFFRTRDHLVALGTPE